MKIKFKKIKQKNKYILFWLVSFFQSSLSTWIHAKLMSSWIGH